jgi:hypothetical protein
VVQVGREKKRLAKQQSDLHMIPNAASTTSVHIECYEFRQCGRVLPSCI